MTLVPGGWAIENPFGGAFDPQTDATVRAFAQSGLRAALDAAFGASNVGGKDRAVHVTSFREDGWTPVETESLTLDGKPRPCSDWIRDQMRDAETWTGGAPAFPFTPRAFDASHDS